MGSNNKSYNNKGEKLNESQYVDKVINLFKSDLIGERIELKKYCKFCKIHTLHKETK